VKNNSIYADGETLNLIKMKQQKIEKDNPVPSIDKIKEISNNYEKGNQTALNALYEIKMILQNGVETKKN